jgi:hypothetical protein
VTTRSNVFAVWLTVGYFEVVDDSDKTRPPKLGAEIGRSENRQVRHRMFAIIDRSVLTMSPSNPRGPGPRPFFLNTDSAVAPGTGVLLNMPALSGMYDDYPFAINVNDRLTIDVGPNQEVITVTSINPAANTLTATFTKRHASGVPLTNAGVSTVMGNPGPQPNFDPRHPDYLSVVRYFSIIAK